MPGRKAPARSKKAPSKPRKKLAAKSRTPKKRTELKSSGWYDKAAESLAIRRGSS
jgi:hypothetical protein